VDGLDPTYEHMTAMAIRAVVFDVGETLINEARLWRGWARYLDVSEEEFSAALEDAIGRGQHHRKVFERFRPGLDVDKARRERAAAGDPDVFDARDLYPDALPCLQDLRRRGYRVGIAGNQPKEAEAALKALGFEADIVASSAGWGIAKPNPKFFAKIIEVCRQPAAAIAYVGDRLDNDIVPAREAGMAAVFIERGSWGRTHARRPEAAQADQILRNLDELPDALCRIGGRLAEQS
jgi:HAD superfamily hydrolase (TIGR01549 family)